MDITNQSEFAENERYTERSITTTENVKKKKRFAPPSLSISAHKYFPFVP